MQKSPTKIEPRLPNDVAYWVIPGSVMAGEYPGAANEEEARLKLRHFLACGVRQFLDLTEEREGIEPDRLVPYNKILFEEAMAMSHSVKYQRMPIRDYGTPDGSKQMTSILDSIDRAVQAGRLAYLHCLGGVGRTGLVVACYLKRRGQTSEQAIRNLQLLRSRTTKADRRSPETPDQQLWVHSFSEPKHISPA
jgi:hypothetical protein